MVVVKGHTSVTGGGIYWQLLGFSNPHVLTLFVDSLPPGKRDSPIVGVQYPADESEAWTFDLDAMKEKSPTELGQGLPSWASGKARVAPSPEGGVWRFDITPQVLSE
jgi:hypothetical protein